MARSVSGHQRRPQTSKLVELTLEVVGVCRCVGTRSLHEDGDDGKRPCDPGEFGD